MPTTIRYLDRGAWLSVNGTRELGISDLWLLASTDFCDCPVTDFLAEGFVEIGVDHPDVEARFAGQCIDCGTEGMTGWLTLGVVDPDMDEFYAVNPESIHSPN